MHVFNDTRMQKRLFFLCSLIILPMMGWGQALKDIAPLPHVLSMNAALPKKLQAQLDKFEKNLKKKTVLQDTLSSVIVEEAQARQYFWVLPTFVIKNTSHGHELLETGTGKFNAKKDRLSSALVDADNRIQILNQRRQVCDPALFEFSMEPKGMHMEGNQIVMDAFLPDFVAGLLPTEQRITVKHIASGLTYTYDLCFSFADSVSWHGLDKEMVFLSYPAAADTNLVLAYNHTDKQVMFVQLPFYICGNGIDGANGYDGLNGLNGMNTYSWKDKNGVVHTSKGTCGTPGGNGTDGENGTNGGNFLVMVDSTLAARQRMTDIVTWIDAGKGGKGGKGGIGGTHGRGSGCYGQAPNGTNGKNGKDGKNGDFLYVVTNTAKLTNILIPQ